MQKFTLKQFRTMVPPEFVTDVEVTRDGNTLFIATPEGLVVELTKDDDILFLVTPEGWIRVDIRDESYAVGAYEG